MGDGQEDRRRDERAGAEGKPLALILADHATDVVDVDESKTPLVFDPNNDTDGWKLSDDKILAARGPAYSVSIDRRMAAP